MRCYDTDRVRPLDELLGDTAGEFGSGRDRVCDKDLDTMIWKLGDYENELPLHEAEEYEGEVPIEDELVEKRTTVGRKGRVSFREVPEDEELLLAGETLAVAGSLGGEIRKRRAAAVQSIAAMRRAKPAPQKTAAARKGTAAVQRTTAARRAKPQQQTSATPRKAQSVKKAVAASKAKPARKTVTVAGRTANRAPGKTKKATASQSKRSGR